MNIIALTAMSGAATNAPPSPSPATNGGDFTRSLEQAAGRQALEVLAQASSPRATDTQTPTVAPPGAALPGALAAALPGLPPAGPASLSEGREETSPSADERLEDNSAESAAISPLAPLLPAPLLPAADVPDLADSGALDDLQRIRARLQAIESAGQLPFSGTAETALTGQPAQPAPSPSATSAMGGATSLSAAGAMGGATSLPAADATGRAIPLSAAGATGGATSLPAADATGRAIPLSAAGATGGATSLPAADATGRAIPLSAAGAMGGPTSLPAADATGRAIPLSAAGAMGGAASPPAVDTATPAAPANAEQSSGQTASVAAERDRPPLPGALVVTSQDRPESAARQSDPAPVPAESARAGENPAPSLASTADGATFQLAGVSPSAGGSAATGTPATMSAATTATLTTPLASSEWQRDLGQHLFGLQQRGEREIELHLHPAELGPLSISLKIGESGAQAQFLSAHPQVRAAVEQAIPQLREALAEQGIALGETSVGERQQQHRDERPTGWSSDTSLAGGSNEEAVPGSPETVAPKPLRLEGIDLYA
ncbi:flagellar hook-length control protein FliK [Azorhizophilus paspali]|uniref:flagellar hook-length control protein FliK n=1 Tax=Azorhizophilus paspali TaxID=69963 RepID=UPI00374856E4